MLEDFVYGRCRAFQSVVDTLDRYAESPWPVLLLGETGVGKELLARRTHQRSARRGAPFLPINCAAMPGPLFESELFGHERGAFSGAEQASRGLLRAASGGTIFLDEVGDLDPLLQVKLLRFLDTGELRPVGGTRVERADVRVIAATNVDLYAAVQRGTFRRDLLERLGVLTVRVPALRERAEDIPLVAAHLLRGIRCEFDPVDLEPLRAMPWPGNVRSLRNCLVRAAVRGGGALKPEVLGQVLSEEGAALAALEAAADAGSLTGSLADIEKRAIVSRLIQCHGNRKKTARDLGIAKSTLHEKLRRWRLDDEGAPAPAWSSAGVARGLSL